MEAVQRESVHMQWSSGAAPLLHKNERRVLISFFKCVPLGHRSGSGELLNTPRFGEALVNRLITWFVLVERTYTQLGVAVTEQRQA